MADATLGRRLYLAGWEQGVLLPVLQWSVHFHLDDPLSRIAKSARPLVEAQYQLRIQKEGSALPRCGIANGIARDKDRFVVASQTCDIVKSPNDEPNIVAMRAFTTDNTAILRAAGGNSSRYFLLDPDRSLVADGTVMVLIEKPVLTELTPEPGVIDSATQEHFARWIGHRFSRPAFPDEVVKAVIAPILSNLHEMQKTSDPDLTALDMVKEVRLLRLAGEPPYNIRLLFIIPETGLSDNGKGLARLIARMRDWFDPKAACLDGWDYRNLYQVTAGDYLDTQKIYLDEHTYRGKIIQGLTPPPLL